MLSTLHHAHHACAAETLGQVLYQVYLTKLLINTLYQLVHRRQFKVNKLFYNIKADFHTEL